MKNWKTTLVACLIAAVVAIEPLMEQGTYDWKRLLYAALIAAFGVFAKDANVTGGTTPATAEAEKRTGQ